MNVSWDDDSAALLGPNTALADVNGGTPVGDDGRDFVADFFDRRASRYDGSYAAPGPGRHILAERLRAVLALTGDRIGDSLDVGMGAGRLCAELAARGWNVAGVDISEAMVHRAQQRLPDAADRLRCGPAERLPFEESSFDLITATGVIEYLGNLPAALGELARVLRPDGRAVLSVPNRGAPYAIARRLGDPIARALRRAVDPSMRKPPRGADVLRTHEFVRALRDAGFAVTACRYVSAAVIPAPIDSLMPVTAERVARFAERRRWARRLFGTQIVLAAARTGTQRASGRGH